MRSFTVGVLIWFSSLFSPLVSGSPLPYSVIINTGCANAQYFFLVPCGKGLTQVSYAAHRDFSNPGDLSSLVFDAGARAYMDGPDVIVFANLDVRDYAFTLGPVRPGFADIMIGRSSNGEGAQATIDNLSCDEPGLGCVVHETVPIVLGTPMTVTFSIHQEIEFNAEAPPGYFADGNAEILIQGVRDGSGNPVPIYAATAVPEPTGLASIGLGLIGGAYVIRRRRNGRR